MRFDPKIHHRRSIRLAGYDYTQPGSYFVTICVHERACILGIVNNGTVTLSRYGSVVEKDWLNIQRHFPEVEFDVLMIMPNHIHGILHILGRGEAFSNQNQRAFFKPSENASPLRPASGTQSGSLAAIIQNFKSVSTRKINRIRSMPGFPLWQRDYYEHIVRDETELARIRTYIVNNPLQWESDRENPTATVRKKSTEPWQV